MIITLKEFDRLTIKDKRDLDKKIISMEDAVVLQSIIMKDEPVFKWGHRCLIAQHWVGSISLPSCTIEILPKLYGYVEEEDLRKILTRMILVSHENPAVRKLPGSTSLAANSLMDMLIETFLNALDRYVKEGLQHSYQKISRNINEIKGRIVLNKQLTVNIMRPTKFWCKYSKFTDNNEINQFLKCCLLEMNKVTSDPQNKQRIKYFLNYFIDIATLPKDRALIKTIEFNSVNARSKEPYYYGKLFLENLFSTLNAGNVPISTMLFDMNDVYELFIYKIARRAFGNKVVYQMRGNYLIQRDTDGKNLINLRPDITIKNNDGTITIIDTKWKIPKKFSKESDVYQMNAYSSVIDRVKKIYILYPYIQDVDYLGDYKFMDKIGKDRPLGLRVVDLTKCLDMQKFITDFPTVLSGGVS